MPLGLLSFASRASGVSRMANEGATINHLKDVRRTRTSPLLRCAPESIDV